MDRAVYRISQQEITRRITAFTALLASFFASLVVFSVLVFPQFAIGYFLTFILILIALFSLFVLFRILTIRFFRNFEKTRVLLTTTHLERITAASHELFPLREISGIKIKKTSRGNIREMGICLSDGRGYRYLDGMNDFKLLSKQLIRNCGKTVWVKETTEPLDFDHPAFYPVLGVLTGVVSVLTLKVIVGMSTENIRYFHLATSVLTCIIGGYFLLQTPLAVRYGNASKRSDFLWGFLFLAAGILTGLSVMD